MRIRAVHLILISIALFALGLAMASCAPDTSAPTLVPREASATDEAAMPTAVAIVVDAGTPIATVEPFTDTACLECHNNQERLTELAVEEENEAESLSSGPG
jgi:hypothetical protein